MGEFPAPVVRTPRFYSLGWYSIPCWRTKILKTTQCFPPKKMVNFCFVYFNHKNMLMI